MEKKGWNFLKSILYLLMNEQITGSQIDVITEYERRIKTKQKSLLSVVSLCATRSVFVSTQLTAVYCLKLPVVVVLPLLVSSINCNVFCTTLLQSTLWQCSGYQCSLTSSPCLTDLVLLSFFLVSIRFPSENTHVQHVIISDSITQHG